jgi:hypothetical protein
VSWSTCRRLSQGAARLLFVEVCCTFVMLVWCAGFLLAAKVYCGGCELEHLQEAFTGCGAPYHQAVVAFVSQVASLKLALEAECGGCELEPQEAFTRLANSNACCSVVVATISLSY